MKMGRRNFLIAGSAAAVSPWLPRALGANAPQSPITNRWGEAKTTKLDLEEICVFRGRPGAAYNHHHQILFDRGRLYVSWSNGVANEDDPGQHMLFSVSEDDGKTWSREATITPTPIEKTSAYTAMGIRTYQGDLIAYYGHYAYTDLALNENGLPIPYFDPKFHDYSDDPTKWVHRDTFTSLRISKDRGATWGAPDRIIEKFVPNLRPFPTRSGRLIMPGNITFPYTDDPAGIRRWKRVGLPRLPKWTVDDPEGFNKACSFRHDLRNYCEGSFFQTDDDRIHMMLRTTLGPNERHLGLLAVTESVDNGKTWSEPMLTSYTDCSCRFHFGRLPDGRFFGLSCPNPKGGRTPLVLATSKDGVIFDRHYILGDDAATKPRMPGNAKGGAYGYPTCDIAEGKMYIVFSRAKEDIYFIQLDLSTLS
jgi:BNR repeat-like domain